MVFSGIINLFSDKINLKKVSKPFISPRYKEIFFVRKHDFFYMLHPYKQSTEYIIYYALT